MASDAENVSIWWRHHDFPGPRHVKMGLVLWIVFNPLLIFLLSESRALKYHVFREYILKIYVQTYYGILKIDKCIVIHTKCTIWTVLANPWHEIYSTYQFMSYGLTKHDTYPERHLNTSVIHEMYIVHRSFKLVGWLISTDSIDLVHVILCVELPRWGNDLVRKKLYRYQAITFILHSNAK